MLWHVPTNDFVIYNNCINTGKQKRFPNKRVPTCINRSKKLIDTNTESSE